MCQLGGKLVFVCCTNRPFSRPAFKNSLLSLLVIKGTTNRKKQFLRRMKKSILAKWIFLIRLRALIHFAMPKLPNRQMSQAYMFLLQFEFFIISQGKVIFTSVLAILIYVVLNNLFRPYARPSSSWRGPPCTRQVMRFSSILMQKDA